jgi:hypothetical protein
MRLGSATPSRTTSATERERERERESAPYEWPPTAMRLGSATPRRTTSATAARADAVSCSTYVSLGSASPSPMMGMVGPSSTA